MHEALRLSLTPGIYPGGSRRACGHTTVSTVYPRIWTVFEIHEYALSGSQPKGLLRNRQQHGAELVAPVQSIEPLRLSLIGIQLVF